MKLQPSTLALVATALLLGGVVLFIEAREANQTAISQDEAIAPVYTFEETDVVSLSVETQTLTVTFERNDAGAWQLVDPEEHPAEEAAIAFLLSRLTTNGLVSTTTIDAADQAEFGLDNPSATIKVTLADGTTHTVVLGNTDFTGENAYALIDPEVLPLSEELGEISVAVLSQDIVNGVDRPLSEWKAVIDVPATPDADADPEADEADANDADQAENADEPEAVDAPATNTATPEEEDTTPEAETESPGETVETPDADEPSTEAESEASDAEPDAPEGDTPSSEAEPDDTPADSQ